MESRSWSPELELLRLAARVTMGDQHRQAFVRLANSALDWTLVSDLASRHFLQPLLLHHLTALELRAGGVHDRLRAEVTQLQARNLHLTAEMHRSVARFQEAGINVLVIKGRVMAQLAYPQAAFRPFSDVDLLVHPRDAVRAIRLMEQAGYQPQFALDDTIVNRFVNRYSELAFTGSEQFGLIDLHWNLLGSRFSFGPAADELWSDTQTVLIDGRQVPTLSAYNTFRFLCWHAAKHDWQLLIWLVDLAEWLARGACPPLDRIRPGVPGWRMFGTTLLAVHKILGCSIPKSIEDACQADPQIVQLVARIQREMSESRRFGVNSVQFPWKQIFFRSLERHGDRVRVVRDNLLRGGVLEWQLVRLPQWLFPIYSVMRPIRLLYRRLVRTRA